MNFVKAAAHEAYFNNFFVCLLLLESIPGPIRKIEHVLSFKSSKLARKRASSDAISIPTSLQIVNQSSHPKTGRGKSLVCSGLRRVLIPSNLDPKSSLCSICYNMLINLILGISFLLCKITRV